MSDTEITYVVCYDVPDDRRRSKLAECLEQYGDRVQYSVFEAALPRALFDNMVCQVRRIIDLHHDSVAIYRLCASCTSQSLFLGLAELQERPGREVVFVV